MDEILWCDHSNEISLAVLSHSAICLAGLAFSWINWPLLGVKELKSSGWYGWLQWLCITCQVLSKGRDCDTHCIVSSKSLCSGVHCPQINCRKTNKVCLLLLLLLLLLLTSYKYMDVQNWRHGGSIVCFSEIQQNGWVLIPNPKHWAAGCGAIRLSAARPWNCF